MTSFSESDFSSKSASGSAAGGKNAVIAARCPHCGGIIAERIGISSLSRLAGTHTVRCKICGNGTLSLTGGSDGKIRLSVPCLVCPHPHPFTLATTGFFEKELFVLQCSYSGLDLCFIGTEEKVDEALRASARQLKEIFDEADAEKTAHNFLDADVMQEVMYAVEELAITNRISCDCAGGEPNLSIVVDYDKVRISCKDCGCEKTLYASEREDIKKASELKRLVLLPKEHAE